MEIQRIHRDTIIGGIVAAITAKGNYAKIVHEQIGIDAENYYIYSLSGLGAMSARETWKNVELSKDDLYEVADERIIIEFG